MLSLLFYFSFFVLPLAAVAYICVIFIGYIVGMSEYVRLNNRKERHIEIKHVYAAFQEELHELQEAIHNKDLVGIFLEAFDCIHSYIKYIFTKWLPISLEMNPIVWIPVFFIVLPVSVKHGYRYLNHGCIRNHGNKNNLGHICNYRDE